MNISHYLRTCKQKNSFFLQKSTFFLKTIFVLGVVLFITFIISPYSVLASAKFDPTAAGKAMFNPIISFIDNWYGTGIFTAGVGGAVVAAGDLRTRAMGFGVGSVVAGLTLLGVKAGFDVKIVMKSLTNFA